MFNQEGQNFGTQINVGSQAAPQADLCQQILAAVEARGYRKGWTDDQFIVRQLLKVADELSEATNLVSRSGALMRVLGQIDHIGAMAGNHFKSNNETDFDCYIDFIQTEHLKAELCDVIIPAMVALAVLGGTTDDIKAKALEDVQRGTNYDE